MEYTLFLLVFLLFAKLSLSMRCYKCEPEWKAYDPYANLCAHFDGSDKFLTDCEYSTMCFKRVTSLDLGNGLSTSSIQRGCAQQTFSGDQMRINGRWQAVRNIYEVYEETCAEDPSDSMRATKTMHCYCRGDSCNSAHARIVSRDFLITLLFNYFLWLILS